MNELEEKGIRLAELARRIRLDALDMALAAGSGGSHVGGSLSCVEILAVLYGEVLRFDAKIRWTLAGTGLSQAKTTVF